MEQSPWGSCSCSAAPANVRPYETHNFIAGLMRAQHCHLVAQSAILCPLFWNGVFLCFSEHNSPSIFQFFFRHHAAHPCHICCLHFTRSSQLTPILWCVLCFCNVHFPVWTLIFSLVFTLNYAARSLCLICGSFPFISLSRFSSRNTCWRA